ncbi:MAG: 50S ribosomal protein L7/L12 [Candidatus Latescibacteria bacterium]|nr:50S ribosomal protein L7/L12 [Candidatus Latescibacterota bacterium]
MTETKKNIDQLIESIGTLTVTELADLVKALKDKFNITAQAFAPAAQAPSGAQAGAQAAEEVKSDFIVTLVSVGDKKIQVLKELRALTNLGLKEAKDVIDKTPAVIKEDASKEEADKIKSKLEEVGAKVEIK